MTKNPDGTKTIKLGIYFWTSNKDGTVEMPKKTCWDQGYVSVVSNNRHSIRAGIHQYFHTMEKIPEAIRDVLKRSGIKVISGKKGKEFNRALKVLKESAIIEN